jgi:hypothetical protein
LTKRRLLGYGVVEMKGIFVPAFVGLVGVIRLISIGLSNDAG